jgi:flagellar L-ring protein FlgH
MKNNLKTIALLFLFSICYSVVSAGQTVNIFSDRRAVRTDDILTVIITESAKAGSESGTNTKKHNDVSVSGMNGSGMLKFLPGLGASGSNDVNYDGKANTSREGSLVAKVSARVVQVLDNGNLVINGSKVVEINDEKELIKVSGVVRPQDIESNNIVYSYNIADAQITYSGKGTGHTGQRPGLFARFFNWLF